MRKRICCAFLTLVLVLSLAMCYPVRVVRADALGLEYSLEFMEILYTLMVNGMLAGGAVDAASMDYDSAMDAFESFLRHMIWMADRPDVSDQVIHAEIICYNSDGSITNDALKLLTSVDGTGALQLPDEETWSNFQVVQGGGSGSPGGDPNDNDHFSLIERIKIGTDFLGYMAAWAYNLWTGAVEGLNPGNYLVSSSGLPEPLQGLDRYRWGGSYELDTMSGCKVVRGYLGIRVGSNYFVEMLTDGFFFSDTPVVALIRDGTLEFFTYDSILHRIGIKFDEYLYSNDSSGFLSSGVREIFNFPTGSHYSLNIPVFYDYDAMYAFLTGTSTAGVMNGYAYDFPGLAQSIAEALAPLADIQVSPDILPELAEALAEAAAALPAPDPALDPAVNNDAYKEAVQEAVKSTVPEAAPEPNPDPEPAPLPGEITGIEGVERFKVDLTMIFPFCLPFDLVRLLQALSADPVAPSFQIPFVVPALGIEEIVIIDLSIFDEVAAIFRTGELIAFIITLVFITRKLIKW